AAVALAPRGEGGLRPRRRRARSALARGLVPRVDRGTAARSPPEGIRPPRHRATDRGDPRPLSPAPRAADLPGSVFRGRVETLESGANLRVRARPRDAADPAPCGAIRGARALVHRSLGAEPQPPRARRQRAP